MALKPKRLVVGNWKMYVETLEDARVLAATAKRASGKATNVDIWLAPPAPFISTLARALKQSLIQVGAQSVSSFTEGAHTGEISAAMLKDADASFAIVGHSECRAMGESDAAVNAELKNTLEAGLGGILCVGERERDEHGGHFGFIEGQLRSALAGSAKLVSKLVIAYEPVWAIGKSATDAAKPELVRETAIFIRKTLADIVGRSAALKVPILYGGSVEDENAAALIESADIGGFLVGHASVDVAQFLAIVNACSPRANAHSPRSTANKKIKNKNIARSRRNHKRRT